MTLFSSEARILYLSREADDIRTQLAGHRLRNFKTENLRDSISTDEITPNWTLLFCDERIGDLVYLGLQCDAPTEPTGRIFPIGRNAVRGGGFEVSVAGERRGKGSSRELSPFAERAAGIRAVFAKSFERIYRQNCQNLGLLTSTDFELLARIERGDDVTIEDFTSGLDDVTAQIVRAGGLFAFNMARMSGGVNLPVPKSAARPLTYAEKIIARAAVTRTVNPDDPLDLPETGLQSVTVGDALFLKPDWRFSYDLTTPLGAAMLKQALGDGARVRDPGSVRIFQDHLTFIHQTMPADQRAMGLLDNVRDLSQAQREFADDQGIRMDGLLADRVGSEGISHSLMAERYTLPGQVVVGTDSHTPHSGALGALAFGVGTTDMANAWMTCDVRLRVPASIRVQLDGETGLAPGASAKDVALALLRMPFFREGKAVGKIIEFAGSAAVLLNTDERATLTNMVAELGGLTGLFVPDAETVRFLKERRGIDWSPEPWMTSDEGAVYEETLHLDCATLEPFVARPGDPGHGVPVDELEALVAVDIAYGGSCTGGKREDMERYHEVLLWAERTGLRIAETVEFYLQFGSIDVRDWCEANGMADLFRRSGVRLVEPGCGACINAGPGISMRSGQVTVSAINRNFPGRSGPGDVWLASPATVAASAIAGRIISFAALQRRAA